MFLDIAAYRTLMRDMVPPDMVSDYDLNQAPFLTPLNNLAIVNVTDGDTIVTHAFLYVK